MRPIWVDRILIEPTLKSDLYLFFTARRIALQQHVLDYVRQGNFHDAAIATGRVEGIDILFNEVKKYEREDAKDVQLSKEKGG